ncbi:MAG TPA: hypothetical protein VMF09_15685 [Solirubrobacteraceae bacterium]|nr:hypothetical protein [Solirubrobacteraceae bacterium]
MSANLDHVRSICEDWECGDFSSVEWAHPEVVYVLADGPDPRSATGLRGLADATRSWLSAWKDTHINVDVMKLVFYIDRERAFADLGLDPEGAPPRS